MSDRTRAADDHGLQLQAAVLRAFTETRDIDESLRRCTDAIVDHVGAAFARIWVLDGDVLRLVASSGLYTHLDGAHGTIRVGELKIGRIAAERRPHLTNDVENDERIGDPGWARREGMVAFAGYPLLAGDRLVGVIGLFSRQLLQPGILDTLASVATAVALGIDRHRADEDRETLLAGLDEQRSLLEAVLQQMSVGVLIAAAPSGRVLLANERLAEILGRRLVLADLDDLREHDVRTLDGRPYDLHELPLVRALSGEEVADEQLRYRRPDGRDAILRVAASPVRDPAGETVAAVVAAEDVTAQERAQRRLAAQYGVSSVLAASRTLDEGAPELLQVALRSLGWHVGGLWQLDADGTLRCFASVTSLDDPEALRFTQRSRDTRFRIGEGLPGRAWERREAVWLSDVPGSPNFPRAQAARDAGLIEGLAVPIVLADEVLGILEIFSQDTLETDAGLMDAMSAIGSQLGQFIARSRAWEELKASEARNRATIDASLDCVITIDHRGVVTEFNPAAERTFGYSREEALGRTLGELIIPPRYREAHAAGLRRYLETNTGTVLDRRLELEGMHKDGRVFPVELTIARVAVDGPPVFTGFIRDITERKRTEHNLRESRERFAQLARTLQESLLPPEVPKMPGMSVAAAYRPAGTGLEIGGDFYDFFERSPGRWSIAIGDICGKGAEAAVVTALARYTLRAAVMREDSPANALAVLNEAILREHPERFSTVVLADTTVTDDGILVRFACGGHPRPILVRDGRASRLACTGSLLGVFDDPECTDATVELREGDCIVLHTDGVSEARNADGNLGEDRLMQAIERACGRGCSGIVEDVVELALAWQGGQPRDDIAVIALRAGDDTADRGRSPGS